MIQPKAIFVYTFLMTGERFTGTGFLLHQYLSDGDKGTVLLSSFAVFCKNAGRDTVFIDPLSLQLSRSGTVME